MKILLSFLLAVSLLNLKAQEEIIVFKNASIVSTVLEDSIIKNQDVCIANGHIIEITKSKRNKHYPDNTRIINCKGKYICPGLADMHTHLPGKYGAKHNMDDFFFLNIAKGVTVVRGMRGEPEHLPYLYNKGNSIRPLIYSASPTFTSDGKLTPYSAEILIKAYKKDGFHFLKYLGGMDSTAFEWLSDLANKNEIALAGHVAPAGIDQAIDTKMKSIEHMGAFLQSYNKDSIYFKKQLQRLSKEKIFICPDIYWYFSVWVQTEIENLAGSEGVEYVDPEIQKEWIKEETDYRLELIAKDSAKHYADIIKYKKYLSRMNRVLFLMNSYNVPLLVSAGDGAFIVPGFGIHKELEIYETAGLSNWEIIEAATINAARCLDAEKKWGSIEVGKQSNFLVLNENPLAELSTLKDAEWTVVNKHLIGRSEIDRRLKEMESKLD